MNLTSLPFTLKVNFVTIAKLLKKLFCHKPTNPINTSSMMGKRVLISFAINNYPNPANNLNGCINDQNNILRLFKDYDEKIALTDGEVTIENFKQGLKNLIARLNPEDTLVIHYSGHGTQVTDNNGDESDGYDEGLYLYDGILRDDEFGNILSGLLEGTKCLVLLDSCFSGTATRSVEETPKAKFINLGFAKSRRNKAFIQQDIMKWTVISGCKENQTSADAYIAGTYNGAFTYYFCESAKPGQTLKDWFKTLEKSKVTKYQNPTLEGINTEYVYL